MRRELPYFLVDGCPGGNQDILRDLVLRFGGCAAITATECCIYLALYRDMRRLCPDAKPEMTQEEYDAILSRMKPHLHPTIQGLDRLELFTGGFSRYLLEVGELDLAMGEFDGDRPLEEAVSAVRSQIDGGLPIPFLMLRNRDKTLDDFIWHWFLLTGYEDREEGFFVRVTSYGEEVWLELRRLWDTGFARRGGMILLVPAPRE